MRLHCGMASRTATDLRHPQRAELEFTNVLAALSDPVRLAIVARLADAEPEGELACTTFALPVSKSTQSGHFKSLREAGVIGQRDEGTRRLNRLRRDDLRRSLPRPPRPCHPSRSTRDHQLDVARPNRTVLQRPR